MGSHTPIAVVGMGCVVPGASNLAAFQSNILAGRDVTRAVPAGRWVLNPRHALADNVEDDRVYSLRGCFVEDFALDPRGLALDSRMLAGLDPLYQLVLHAGRDAFFDGVTAGLDRERVDVILAAIALPTDASSKITQDLFGRDFEEKLFAQAAEHTAPSREPNCPDGSVHPLNGRVVGLPAALLAKALGLGGGSYTLDAACASSLYAVKLGCEELRAGRADAILAGGVSRPDCLYTQMGFSQLHALSRSGRCAPFDESCDGLIVGEGAGIVLLKRLEDALSDGDRIRGVIRGIGLSNDIGGSLLAPDSEGQLRAMRQAYEESGWSPQDVDYIECHGTGTPLGDAVEIRSLRTLWGETGWRPGQCPVGSVKSMIGHLLTAAGAAGLIKMLLALREGMLPPSANFRRSGSVIPLDGSPFRVQTQAAPWATRDDTTPRRAAVNAFGFGGINAHVLVEAWDEARARPASCHAARSPARPAVASPQPSEVNPPIAVVGMEARFGAVSSVGAFFELVRRGATAVRARPADRWGIGNGRVPAELGGRVVPGAYLDPLSIPAGRYRLPPNEIPEVLPQQLLILDVVAASMRDADMSDPERRPRVGVIIGIALDFATTDFHLRWWLPSRARQWTRRLGLELTREQENEWIASLRKAAGPALNATRTVGALGNIIASRIARECRLGGPSFAVSCDEASGLRAIEIAVRALQRGELDAAVVGAVDLAGDLRAVLTAHALRPLSASGNASPFDVEADGTGVAEGAAALVLKRYDDARRCGDRVYAVIRGLGFASGGGIDAQPASARAYGSALRRAYADAGVSPEDVGFVEAHGSGDPEEDAVEAAELRTFFANRPVPLSLGSVKANIGHAGAAAGIASVVKACLCLHHGVIPPMRGCRRPRPEVGEPLDLPPGLREWTSPRGAAARLAGVSTMTSDGNCAHVVLEGADPAPAKAAAPRAAPTAASSRNPMIIVPIGRSRPTPPLPDLATPAASDPPGGLGHDRAREETVPAMAGSIALNGPAGVEHAGESVETRVARAAAATAGAHEAFLRFSRGATQAMEQTLTSHARLLRALQDSGQTPAPSSPAAWPASVSQAQRVGHAEAARPAASEPVQAQHLDRSEAVVSAEPSVENVAYSREACLEFARGSVERVLGPEFAEADTYPVRVRLPNEPLMFVDRILSIEGKKGSLTAGRIVTEHEVPPNAWYLDGGRVPTAITVEAGQADLFLCAYLGIDRAVKGRRAYRLLDATVRFHRGLPRVGEVIRYDIAIDRFVRQGATHLFFFRFDGTVGGEPLLTMRNGCAGFFTPEEVRRSGGIILTPEDEAPTQGRRSPDWRDLVPMNVESYDDAGVAALRDGDLAGCFGPQFAGLDLQDPMRLPGGQMKLFDRVLELNPTGGRFGLGIIRTEADIHPKDWFLTCHFVDDMTMPGTLMYECCLHALRFFLLRMGWVGEQSGVRIEPITGVDSTLRCRGPVTPATKKVVYQVEIKEIGYRPEPTVVADALMFADGRRIVQMKDMTLRMTGLSREQIEANWSRRRVNKRSRPTGHPPTRTTGPAPEHAEPRSEDPHSLTAGKTVVFDKDQFLAFALGKPSEAFGEPYRVFDQQRRIARLPAPPYQFIDRITGIEGQAWQLTSGAAAVSEYDVPPDAWYFRANRQASMPYCVLLEVGLQTCGWLAAYLGSALRSETDLCFRNLGGSAIPHVEVFADAGTLTSSVRLTDVSEAGGIIIERFDFRVTRGERVVYEGDTSFGFFSEAALAQQAGIRDAEQRVFAPTEAQRVLERPAAVEDTPPLTPDDPSGAVQHRAVMPAGALRMIDEVTVHPDGGPHGLGYGRATAAVDPDAWFFKAHFHQDPVCPGSLGLEAFLQVLKAFALDRWGADIARTHRFEPIALGVRHEWIYRGQVLRANRRVDVQATITQREDGPNPMLLADGFLSVDGLHIYEMRHFGLRLVRSQAASLTTRTDPRP